LGHGYSQLIVVFIGLKFFHILDFQPFQVINPIKRVLLIQSRIFIHKQLPTINQVIGQLIVVNVIKVKSIYDKHDHSYRKHGQRILKQNIMNALVRLDNVRDQLQAIVVTFVILDLLVPVPVQVSVESE
jgi:hypothetical protein